MQHLPTSPLFAAAFITLGTALTSGTGGCGMSHPTGDADTVMVGADGWSEDFAFDVPRGSATLTVVIEGDEAAFFALGSLRLADGVEQLSNVVVDVRDGVTGTAPNLVTVTEGTAAFQYPTLATQSLLAGPATLRVRSDRPGAARVTLFFGSGTGRTLHIGLASFAGAISEEPPFVDHAADILAAAGITLVVDEVAVIGDRRPVVFEGTARPGDLGAMLFADARPRLGSGAFMVMVVEMGGDFRFGFARGLPSPPNLDSHRRAVVIDPTTEPGDTPDPDRFVGRILAHELGHALGLHHPEGVDVRGEPLLDPFSDTRSLDDTLMGSAEIGAPISEASVRLSPQQVFAMTRSALLE